MNGRFAQLFIGFWILVSPWLLGFSGISIMKWSNVLCGLILILASVWEMFGIAIANARVATGNKNVSVSAKGELKAEKIKK